MKPKHSAQGVLYRSSKPPNVVGQATFSPSLHPCSQLTNIVKYLWVSTVGDTEEGKDTTLFSKRLRLITYL